MIIHVETIRDHRIEALLGVFEEIAPFAARTCEIIVQFVIELEFVTAYYIFFKVSGSSTLFLLKF